MNNSDGVGAYVALLRGVNVGGRRKLSMESLRDVFYVLGFDAVRTVVQSGNVLFTSAEPPDAEAIERAIERTCGLAATVLLRTAEQFRNVVETVPFDSIELATVHVGFLRDRAKADLLDAIDAARFAPERVILRGTEVYFSLPDGMGRAKLPPAVDRKLTTPMTVRNWNSVNRLCALLDD